MRNNIASIISSINPLDEIESLHIKESLGWIRSGVPIFRIKNPDTPPKHLVSYFVLFDQEAQKILLTDHKKAGLWLPAGGHVEINEHPHDTVTRECLEELGIEADFWNDFPLFITSTVTVGSTPGHTDVSLWYILKGNHQRSYIFDQREFNNIKWFSFNDIPYEKSDPHMRRFVSKLLAAQ